jgi:hypothetical protein
LVQRGAALLQLILGEIAVLVLRLEVGGDLQTTEA